MIEYGSSQWLEWQATQDARRDRHSALRVQLHCNGRGRQ